MKNWQDSTTHPPDLVSINDPDSLYNSTNYEILKRTNQDAISNTYFANDYPNFQRFMKNWQDSTTSTRFDTFTEPVSVIYTFEITKLNTDNLEINI